MSNDTLLRDMLATLVPFRIQELQAAGGPSEADWQRATAFADVLGSQGDVLLYKSPKPGETSGVAAGLIHAVAVLAFRPGGVTTFGEHFDASAPFGRQRE